MAAGKLMNENAATKQTVSPTLTRTLERVAEREKFSVAQLSLAWLLRRSPVLLPIPGTSNIAHLEENVAAAAVNLDADQWRVLDAALV